VHGEFACTRVRPLPRARARAACEPSAEFGPIGLQLNRSTQQFHRIRLLGDTQQEASSSEVSELRKEKARLEELVAETLLENRLLEESVTASDSPEDEACE
jgi:hypothetical protein